MPNNEVEVTLPAIPVVDDVAVQGVQVATVGIPGIQGPPGPPGEELVYRHVQGTASATWTINHNLGQYLNVTVVDSSGRQVEGNVIYEGTDSLVIEFTAPFSGEAYVS